MDVDNDIELLNFIDVSRSRLKPDINDMLKKFLSDTFQTQGYVPGKKKQRFNLNNEKTAPVLDSRGGQPNLIDEVCHKQRLDQEQKLMQEIVIQKQKETDRRNRQLFGGLIEEVETPQSYKDMSIFSKDNFMMNGKG